MEKIKRLLCKVGLFFLCIGLVVNIPIKTYASNIMTIQDFGNIIVGNDIGVNRNGDIIIRGNGNNDAKIKEIKVNSDGTNYDPADEITSFSFADGHEITGMALDKAGDIFLADSGIDNNIKEIKVNSDGATYSPTVSTINVTGDPPSQIAVDNSGNIFYIDNNYKIKEIKINNNGSYTADAITIGNNNSFGDISIDRHGNIFVTDSGNNTIKEIKVNSDGTYSAQQKIIDSTSGINNPCSISIDSNDNIFVTDGDHDIKKIKAKADGGYTITTIADASSGINVPLGITVDDNGNIFICEQQYVKKLLPAKVIYDANGGTGTAAADAAHYYTNDTVTVKENNTLIKSGYVFGGWNTKADGTGTNYDPADVDNNTFTMGDSDVTLYAKWIPTVIGISAIQDITVDNGTAKNNIGLPASINITLNDLTTTSAAVTWDNGTSVSDGTSYNGNEAGTYVFNGTLAMPDGVANPNNLKATVNVIVGASGNPVNEATPAAVRIVGTEKAENTLSAELLDNNDHQCTTSAAVTYQWYRLNNRNDGFSNVIGNNKTYILTDADAGKYIGLSAKVDGVEQAFKAISGRILANSTPVTFVVNTPTSGDNGVNDDGKSKVTINWTDSTTTTVDHYEIVAKVGAPPSENDIVAGETNISKGTQTASFDWNAGDNLYVGVVAVDTNGLKTLCNGTPGSVTVATDGHTPTITAPQAPTNITASAGDGYAVVYFTPPINNGGSSITNYVVTSNKGGITKVGTSSPITITGLTDGTAYTFTVKAVNAIGESAASAASNSVTPYYVPPYVPPTPVQENVTVPIEIGNGENKSIVNINAVRALDTDGVEKGTLKLDEDTSKKIATDSVDAKSNEADVVLPTDAQYSNDKIDIQLPKESITELAESNISLNIGKGKAALELSAQTLATLKDKDAEIKIKQLTDSSQIEETKSLILQLTSGGESVSTPISIETNFSGRAKITLPIDVSKFTGKDDLNKYLSSLAVLVQHSDGENAVDKGTIEYDSNGNPVGISIWVNKFSDFTLIQLPEDYFKGKTTVMKDKVEVDKEWHLKFTKAADPATVTPDNIYVTDSKGNKFDVKVSCESDDVIKVSPVNPYKSGESYYIYITKKVTSKYKEPLTEDLRYEFTIK